jgi:hypothetical protein
MSVRHTTYQQKTVEIAHNQSESDALPHDGGDRDLDLVPEPNGLPEFVDTDGMGY